LRSKKFPVSFVQYFLSFRIPPALTETLFHFCITLNDYCHIILLFPLFFLLSLYKYLIAGIHSRYSDWLRAGLSDNLCSIPGGGGSVNFSLLHHIQTGTGAHPASYPMVTGGVKLTTHLHLVPRSNP